MNVIFYIIIFIIGTILGSICAKIAYRIVKEKRVCTINSYCSNCGEKLTFFEQIPILSYIFFKGKCKHCNNKIEETHIILELVSGILFLILAIGMELNFSNINVTKFISFIFMILYISYVLLTIVIDKRNRGIPAVLLSYGIIISLVYIVYECIMKEISLYTSIVYLVTMVILLLANVTNTKKRAKSSYILDLLTMLLIMLIFVGPIICILTIIGTLISISLYIIINKIKKTKGKKNKTIFASKVKIAYIMGSLNLVIFLMLINIFK